jgi:hypothetical protein
MSANTYLKVTELDFEEIRTNLKTYLSSQDKFSDYSFEGSAMSVLLDVLAYNTHYNAYYLNMVANEMFLDTAQQRDSVVSRAKELGYAPTSAIGSQADVVINFTGVDASVPQLTIPKNSKFAATVDDVTYTFVSPEAVKIDRSTTNTFSKTITIKEGEPLSHAWTASSSNPVRYIIPNTGVDTSSITVKVQNSSTDSTVTEFKRATNVNQVFTTSPVFFLEESADKKYEIVFGQGGLGKSIQAGNIITVDYLVCNGSATDGVGTFSVESVVTGVTPAPTATITSVTKKASGGRAQESIESIKFNAPRNFQTQNRAVVANDYDRIILSENSDLQSVIAFGGEEYDPPTYGKVYIAVKPFNEEFATITRKQRLRDSIKDRTPLAVDPVIIDADYTYLIPTINVNYDLTRTALTDDAIASNVRDSIKAFSDTNLERFGNKLRYSRFVRALDNTSEGAILNTDAAIRIEKRFVPNINVATNVKMIFNNPVRENSILSTQFTYSGFPAYLGDDGLGNIDIFRFSAEKTKINIVAAAGTIDYTTGAIEVQNFAPTAFSDIQVKVSASTKNFDVVSIREQLLIIDSANAVINVQGEQI